MWQGALSDRHSQESGCRRPHALSPVPFYRARVIDFRAKAKRGNFCVKIEGGLERMREVGERERERERERGRGHCSLLSCPLSCFMSTVLFHGSCFICDMQTCCVCVCVQAKATCCVCVCKLWAQHSCPLSASTVQTDVSESPTLRRWHSLRQWPMQQCRPSGEQAAPCQLNAPAAGHRRGEMGAG